jgi:hypothetical protein
MGVKRLIRLKLSTLAVCFLFLLSSCGGGDSLFRSESKKGPNIYSSKGPKSKSRTKRYSHSISKKKAKRKNAVFSATKKRYGSSVSGAKGGKEKGGKSSSGGRKSGKGRKK